MAVNIPLKSYFYNSNFQNAQYPISVACRFKTPTTSGGYQRIQSWGNSSYLIVPCSLLLNYPSAGYVSCQSYYGTGAAYNVFPSISSYSTTNWNSVVGIAYPTATTILLNGVQGEVSVHRENNDQLIGVNYFSVGYMYGYNGQYFSGQVAELGVWNCALDLYDTLALNSGVSPLLVRPASLIAYYPFGGAFPQNGNSFFKNAYNLTASGSPTYVDHPNTVYPGNKNILYPLYYNNILDVIYPSNYYYMSSETNYANLSIRNDRECLTFSPTTSQSAYFTRIMPNHYSNNGCCVYLYVAAASDIRNSFSFNVSFERIGERNLDLDTNLFTSTKRRYNATPPPTCGNIQVLKIPFSKEDMKRLKGGELYTLKVQRAVDYDTGAGNAELYAIEIRD